MRTIGLIGGMSWESTAVYYRLLNEGVRDRLGGLHSADILLRSVDFETVVALQKAGDWEAAGRMLTQIGTGLEAAGADCLMICTNTMHLLADEVQAAMSVPLINIIDVVAEAVAAAECQRPLVLATRYTMEEDFYVGRMRRRHGLEPMVPDAAGRSLVHDVIFDELCKGRVDEGSRRAFVALSERAAADGADSVIFGCTEVGLLLSPSDVALPAFDSTVLHARAAIDFALGGDAATIAAA
ncbi:aspartate/glutamate racemase family protein [Amorphus coralli]|uniref:aspartate/glutamate racemase family protein n=1 Tax=Amorphus coralli TaxID=340680 RepID=UPI0003610BCE|nr:aspartate/glutamate racemase family protein [Amorphus coralli]